MDNNYYLVDCQQKTEHLVSLGATGISRSEFESYLNLNAGVPENFGYWKS